MICKPLPLKIAFFTLLCTSLTGCGNDDKKPVTSTSQLEEKAAAADSLLTELNRQKELNDSLRQYMETNYYANDYSVFFGKEYEEIEDPEAHIIAALKRQKGLIPLKAVLGGNMDFRQVQVISEEWVLAIFDDGHVQGKSIFAYELQEDGAVEFTEVATKLPD